MLICYSQVNSIIGMALAVGGLCQLLAGMCEFAHGHTFGATGEFEQPSNTSHFLTSHIPQLSP